MAKTIITSVSDDIDGSADAQTVTFGYQGVAYSIDLGLKNQAKLEKALEPFIQYATRQRGTTAKTSGRTSSGRDYDIASLRAWAAKQKIEVPSRGRIPGAVVEQYKAAGGR